MNYPWWLRSVGEGVGCALVAALFSDVIFGVARMVLPLSNATFERWVDDPPVAALVIGAGVLCTVFSLGICYGQRSGPESRA